MRSKHTTAGKRDVEKLIQPGGVWIIIWGKVTIELVPRLGPDPKRSRNSIMLIMTRKTGLQEQLAAKERREGIGRGAHILQMIICWIRLPPHKTQQKQSPVRPPLQDPDPPTPKLVIHDDEKLTSEYDSSSNNTSPASSSAASSSAASSSAASPEKITRFTQTDTIVNLCGQMHWLRLMYKPVVLNKE